MQFLYQGVDFGDFDVFGLVFVDEWIAYVVSDVTGIILDVDDNGVQFRGFDEVDEIIDFFGRAG